VSTFSERFYNLRNEHGYSLSSLADELNKRYGTNFTKSAFSKWENGKSNPSFENIPHIADFFGVSVDYLIGISDSPDIKKDQPKEPVSENERYVIKFRDAMNKVDENQRKLIIDGIENMYKMLGIDTNSDENT